LHYCYPQMVNTYTHINHQFRSMKIANELPDKGHRGEYIQAYIRGHKIDGQRITQNWIAEKLGISRKTLENWLDKPNLEASKIRAISNVVRYDFSEVWPDLRTELAWKISDEIELHTKTEPLEELARCRAERDRIKDLYIDLLEKHSTLKEEFFKLKLSNYEPR